MTLQRIIVPNHFDRASDDGWGGAGGPWLSTFLQIMPSKGSSLSFAMVNFLAWTLVPPPHFFCLTRDPVFVDKFRLIHFHCQQVREKLPWVYLNI